MTRSWLIALFATFSLAGCTALKQFPEVPKDYSKALSELDPSYDAALKAINETDSADEQERIRNEEIERRLLVINLNFAEFEKSLAQDNVQVDFGVALAGVGVGAVGAFVAETASQVLSAVSGGLAGGQAAYRKAALFDQAFPALLAQMRASRNKNSVKIYKGMTLSYKEYTLSMADLNLRDYIFAGSLPGAIVATAEDAKTKNDESEEKLLKILANQQFKPGENTEKIEKYLGWDETNFTNADNVRNLNAWKQLNDINIVSNTSFLNAGVWQSLRAKAVQDLNIQ